MKQYQVRSRLDLLQTKWIKGDGVYHRYDSFTQLLLLQSFTQ
jgi:hypothetical protein